MADDALVKLVEGLQERYVGGNWARHRRYGRAPVTVELEEEVVIGDDTIPAGTEATFNPPKPGKKLFIMVTFSTAHGPISVRSNGSVKRVGGGRAVPRTKFV